MQGAASLGTHDRTNVVSKKESMTHASMKLWLALTDEKIFQQYQKDFLSIFDVNTLASKSKRSEEEHG